MWRATVFTLHPELLPGPLDASVLGRGRAEGIWSLETVNIRDFADNPYGSVDDAPYGGGAGLVMRADILAAAIDSVPADGRPLLYLTPRGAPLTQGAVRDFASAPGVLCLCGRFEGVDQRLIEARGAREVSIGDFVLAGGEVAAMALIEACVRLLPGVLGSPLSLGEESFSGGDGGGLLEYPQYTRPRVFEGREVPPVLLSGDHDRIARWRREQAEAITRARRPDLIASGPIRRDKDEEKAT
jgi:tRNA (guanine37-N1)-methyltransferase